MVPKTCSVPECAKAIKYRGMCNPHYRASRPKIKCTMDGCDKPGHARGWCGMHYKRWESNGDPSISLAEETLEQRFWARVSKTSTCWNWTGVPSDTGYGHIMFEGTDQGAHRVSWEIHRGPIPGSMYIDHRCHNRVCVNPGHLRLATNKQNGENHQGPTAASSTGARGVYLDRRSGRYATQVTHNGERYSAGGFATIEEADAAVTALRLKLFTHNDRDKIAA